MPGEVRSEGERYQARFCWGRRGEIRHLLAGRLLGRTSTDMHGRAKGAQLLL